MLHVSFFFFSKFTEWAIKNISSIKMWCILVNQYCLVILCTEIDLVSFMWYMQVSDYQQSVM